MSRLRVVFMGTPGFALPALAAVIAAGHDIACAYTRPPRRAGRGRRVRPSAVHTRAEAAGIRVRTPASLKEAGAQRAFAALAADVAVVVAYGLILPIPVLEAPRLGCINIHASLLPRWRGAAPIERAILAGDSETGITIIRIDEGLDTGPILLRRTVAIGEMDSGALHDRLAELGAELVVEALAGLAAGTLAATPQPEHGATTAAKLTPEDEALDWTRPAQELARRVRALSPRPRARFTLDREAWKVLAAQAVGDGGGAAPGTVLDWRLTVACGEGALRLLRVQRPGRTAMAAEEALRGRPVPAGTMLG
jgi:methionyl-tRNA formyltransferase